MHSRVVKSRKQLSHLTLPLMLMLNHEVHRFPSSTLLTPPGLAPPPGAPPPPLPPPQSPPPPVQGRQRRPRRCCHLLPEEHPTSTPLPGFHSCHCRVARRSSQAGSRRRKAKRKETRKEERTNGKIRASILDPHSWKKPVLPVLLGRRERLLRRRRERLIGRDQSRRWSEAHQTSPINYQSTVAMFCHPKRSKKDGACGLPITTTLITSYCYIPYHDDADTAPRQYCAKQEQNHNLDFGASTVSCYHSRGGVARP